MADETKPKVDLQIGTPTIVSRVPEPEAPEPSDEPMFPALQEAKRKYIDPLTRPIFEHVIDPVAERVAAGALAPRLLERGTGPTEAETKAARSAMSIGASVALPTAADKIKLATPLLSALARIAVTSAESGAVQLATNALTPDARIEENVGTAVAASGGLSAVAEAAPAVVATARKLGKLGKESLAKISGEIDQAIRASFPIDESLDALPPKRMEQILRADAAAAKSPMHMDTAPSASRSAQRSPPEASLDKASIINVVVGEAGVPEARIVELGADGQVLARSTMPLGTTEERLAFAKLRKEKADGVHIGIDAPALRHTSTWGDGETRAILSGEIPEPAPKTVSGRRPSQVPPPDLDAAPVGPAAHAEVEVDGTHLRFRQPAPELPPEPVTQPMSLKDHFIVKGGEIGGGSGKNPLDPPTVIANVEDLAPAPPPMPPAPQPGQLPPHTIAEIDQTMKVVQQLQRARDPKLIDKVMGGLLADHLRGPAELQQVISAMHGARSLNAPAAMLAAVRKSMPQKKLFDAAARDLNAVAIGKNSLERFAQIHPEVAADQQRVLSNLLDEVQANSKEIESLGGIAEGVSAMRDAGLMDQYVANVYRAHYLGKGKWAQIVPSDVMQDGINFLHKQNPKWSRAQVAAEVLDILNADDPIQRFTSSGLGNAQNALRARKEIPPEIRKLLGEENSGPIRIAVTLAKQRSILNQLKIWDELSRSPHLAPDVTVGEATGHVIQIPNDPHLYGRAAGMAMRKELAPLLNIPNAHKLAPGFLDAVGGWVKGNQVVLGGVRPWVNNFMRNMKGSVLAGGLDPFRPVESAKSAFEAVSAMRGFLKDPSTVGKGRLVLEAKRVGALPAGFGRTEVTPQGEFVFEELAKSLGRGDDLYSGLASLRQRLVKNPYSWTKKKLAVAYDSIDSFFKMANYISLRKRYLAEGMELEPAARQAAMRINQSFPNFEHVGRWTERARSSAFGSVNPYVSSALEDARVNLMLPSRLRSEPDLIARIVASTALVGGAAALGTQLRRLNGITDEEVDEVNAIRTKASQVYRPGIVAMPTRDSAGRVQFWDWGSWLPELQLAQGNPDDPTWKRVAYNALTTPIQGSLADPFVREYVERAGLISPLPGAPPKLIHGEEGTLKAMQPYFLQSGAIPGAVASAISDAQRTFGVLSPRQERLTPGQFAARQLGAPIAGGVTSEAAPGGSPTRRAGLAEYNARVNDLRRQMASVAKSTRPSDEKQRLIREISLEIVRLGREQAGIQSTVSASKEAQAQ